MPKNERQIADRKPLNRRIGDNFHGPLCCLNEFHTARANRGDQLLLNVTKQASAFSASVGVGRTNITRVS